MMNKNRIAVWVDTILNELSKLKDDKGIEILHLCGGQCSTMSALFEAALKIRNENIQETNTDKLFDNFKTQYYNTPRLTKQGDKIILIFDECTCPLVKEGASNAYLCNCTVGYTKKIFETLFNRKVDVELEQSILNGGKMCKQIISIV